LLETKFEMTNMGEIHLCLGVQIIRNRIKGWIKLSKKRYLFGILHRFKMENNKPISTPMEVKNKLTKENSVKSKHERTSMKEMPYPQAIGCLMYAIVNTRVDLAITIESLSQYLSNPRVKH